MAFGRRKDPEPTVEPVAWDSADWFVISAVERPATLRRKAVTGPRCVRTRVVEPGVELYAPAVFIAQPDPETKAYELYPALDPRTLLCALAPVKGGRGGERYRVTDGQGQELGTVHRTGATKRTVQHAWWLEQPGHPDIVARYHWAKGSAKDVRERGASAVVRGAGQLAESVVDSLILGGSEGGDSSTYESKPVTWRAGETEVALTSGHTDKAVRTYTPRASWLDRRLALALAVLREG
ncbi:hypothetical protein [Streptomyces sp. NBC_01766]|uniref:hypothetical protein n=1 Tax=Streptomyces sp. NBC_01766 TaxID=2975936 RepID=UPI002DDC2506|nr:hypothetical protein [Streptomyces sp. NBC_01766]WSC20579.1 hypothetical protein OIE60_13255 [Streptomyces sp. NBC_01766]